MQPITLVILLIIIYVYVSYYYRYPAIVKVLNTFEDEFNTSLMLEKQPIVVLDVHASTLAEFKETTVPYLFSKAKVHLQYDWAKNRSKYLFIRATAPTDIHILPASKTLTASNDPHPDETLITLQIKSTHVVILPLHWHYYSPKTPLELLAVDDYISWILP